MIKKNVRVVNKLGLHARAASQLVNEANKYDSSVRLCCNGQEVDAKSIMGIMMLAASHGVRLELIVNGTDEEKAAESIMELFESRFGENE